MKRLLLSLAILISMVSCNSEESVPEMTPVAAGTDASSVSVYYITNRNSSGPDEGYGGARGAVAAGVCTAEFKKIPVVGDIAPKLKFYIPRETNELRVAEAARMGLFRQQLKASIQQNSTESVVLFVHGYNYGFERNCRMAAELQRTIQGNAQVLMFSWPSDGDPMAYVSDQADMEWSVPLLARVIQELGEQLAPDKIRLVAHSLGSRGAIFALEWLSRTLSRRPLVGDLVLLAPDFDAQSFLDRLPGLVPLTDAVTLYASGTDTPLRVSRQLSGYPRLGEAGEFLTVADGMETVDVSPAGRYEMLGHEYFYFHPQVSMDLANLLVTGKAAGKRPGLRPVAREGRSYWALSE